MFRGPLILAHAARTGNKFRPVFSRNITKSRKVLEESAKKPTEVPPVVDKPKPADNRLWFLTVAAALGATIYFKDEIAEIWQTYALKKPAKEGSLPAAPKKIAEKAAAAVAPKPVVPISTAENPDWEVVKAEIAKLLDDENYDDGSYGPVFVRLAWHNAGTFDKNTGKGGSEGACMRFKNESSWGANNGLAHARDRLEVIKKLFPGISYSDIWSLAGNLAIEEMGGPKITWRPGRKDFVEEKDNLPDGLLPDADGRNHKEKPGDHLRDIFYRMNMNDQDIVALSGAHALGRCHTPNSGYTGPWTFAPTTFSNEYFRLLVEETWTKKSWVGNEQYEDSSKELMMLPTDMALVEDPSFKKWVEIYAKDEDKFFKDFSKAWIKLQENGVKQFNAWRRYIFFGPRE